MSKSDRNCNKIEKFYQNPKHEECYDLGNSITEFLIPRLQMFIEDSDKYIDWDEHKKREGIDIPGELKEMIRKLQYIHEHSYVFDDEEAKKCAKYAKEVFTQLGKIYFYLWW